MTKGTSQKHQDSYSTFSWWISNFYGYGLDIVGYGSDIEGGDSLLFYNCNKLIKLIWKELLKMVNIYNDLLLCNALLFIVVC